MSKFKDQTENIRPLSSGEKIEEREPQSSPLATQENTQTYMQTTQAQSLSTSKEEKNEQTGQISEKSRQHAMIASVALSQLLKNGLIKRYKVLSKEGSIQKIMIEFNMDTWTPELDLK